MICTFFCLQYLEINHTFVGLKRFSHSIAPNYTDMQVTHISLFSLLWLLMLTSCEQGLHNQDLVISDDQYPLTLDASDVSVFKATLHGSLPAKDMNGDASGVWFLYSPSENGSDMLLSEGRRVEAVLQPDGSFAAACDSLKMSARYCYVACARIHDRILYGDVKSFTTIGRKVPKGAVELGLSVMWASCNVGASNMEGNGDYFAWGEISPKKDYSWQSYRWCNGTYNTLTKYCTDGRYGIIDDKQVLDLEDDAAHARLGASWRMPTDEEWMELQKECTWSWTSINGTEGFKVTSNKTGYTDRWIFLPAAGHRHETDLFDSGSYGLYWSSSLNEENSYDAWYVYFYSGYVSRRSYYYYDRYLGRTIRPVAE